MSILFLEKNLLKIQRKIIEIETQLEDLPEGNFLAVTGGGKYSKWYVSNNNKKEYIPKKQRNYAEQLALRKYLVTRKEELLEEMVLIKRCIKEFERIERRSQQLKNDYKYAELIDVGDSREFELEKWTKESFEGNPLYKEDLNKETMSGILVRSKSEQMIADELWRHGVPFRYEAPVMLSGGLYYPDFTICHPRTGKIKYWEHFGVMNDSGYVDKSVRKLGVFAKNGIIPGIDLIMTFETTDMPVDVELVVDLIDYYFGQ